MKIATWNVNSLNARLPHLLQWLREFTPDVVGLQETKLEDHRFPDDALAELGYRSVFHGQKTYNGVAILVRGQAPADTQAGIPGFEDPQARAIAATVSASGSLEPGQAIRIVNLYVVNGQDVGTDKYDYKLRWLDAVHGWLADELQRHPRLVVLGDFNIAPDDRDVHDPATWNDDHILTSTAERAALKRLLALGLHDGFRLRHADGGHYSWWDYRQAAFRRDLGLRIDLTLVSTVLKDAVRDAGIDKTPRTRERPSDHTPAWVDLAIA